ncbi:SGNH hydrolase [Gonapodya prolifera JEL478]|uniref:SGNH hydrolase n=1 Tax=Gonapodya prolifera (strain JEL478) TaxID=1344416 RepID=A0A139A9C5_GONPJ|nr:SGNH hydrolase [Gonapodya prolifera JEL478]|eukprot:KXS13400.1 SGNH hydrolase [Gonapodya prolifera JEL478]
MPSFLLLGDSYTLGAHSEGSDHTYGLSLKRSLATTPPSPGAWVEGDIEIVVEGQRGDVVVSADSNDGFMGRLQKRLETALRPFDWVILLGGTNDIEDSAKSAESIAAALKALYQTALAHHEETKVLALSVLDYPEAHLWPEMKVPEKRVQLNNLIRDTIAGPLLPPGRAIFFDIAARIPPHESDGQTLTKWYDEDGTHLTVEGYDLMGELIAEEIRKLAGGGQTTETS